MTHGDLIRRRPVVDSQGKLIGSAKVLEVDISDADSTASLVAGTAGERKLVVGGFVNVSAAATIGHVKDDGSTKLLGDLVIGAADSQILYDQSDKLISDTGEPIKVTRSASCALKGEIHIIEVDAS